MDESDQAAESLRSRAGLFTLAFVAALVMLGLLGNFGLPDSALGTTLGVGVLVAFVIAGVSERTIQASVFFTGGGGVPAFVNGIASAAALLSPVWVLGLVSIHFSDYRGAIAVILGWSLGLVFSSVLIAPYFTRVGADSLADYLARRYHSRAVRMAVSLIVALALLPALAATMATGATVIGQLFAVSPQTAKALIVALVLSGTLLGGLRAVTLTAIAQYIVLAIAFVVPAAIVSTLNYSLPLPPLAAGLAYRDAAAFASVATPPQSGLLPFTQHNAFEVFATVVSLAAGVAALPHLVVRQATLDNVRAARRSAGWTLVFVLVIALTAPAYATFARLSFVQDIAGTPLDQLPGWLFGLGQRGLATLCGVYPVSVAAAQSACGAAPLAARDIAVSGDAIVLAWGDIMGLPYVATALIAIGVIAAALAAANAMSFAIAQALGNDLYGRLLDTRASAGRRLIVTRIILVAVVLLGALSGAASGDAVFHAALSGVSLSAGALFPAMVLAVWWRRANRAGALAGILFGFATTVLILFGRRYPGLLPFDPSDLSELSAAIVGIPAGFLAAIVGSLATPADAREAAFVDGLRQNNIDQRRT
jgi:cation/acetate symporter